MAKGSSSSSSSSAGKDDKSKKDEKSTSKKEDKPSGSSGSGKKPVDSKSSATAADSKDKKSSKDKDKDNQQPIQSNEPQKPRWTGKVPVQYLNEYCQKQHMERPAYNEAKAFKSAKGELQFRSKAKKKVITEKSYMPPHSSPTMQEARSYAALVALFDLCGNTNIYKLFPPEYTPFWLQMADDSKVAAAEQERLDKVAAAEAEKAKEKEPTHTQQIPSINMSEEAIRIVHSLVRQMNLKLEENDNNSGSDSVDVNMNELNEKEHSVLASTLTSLGFTESSINSAFNKVKDVSSLTNLISWLCLNVPEDQLPITFRPKNIGIQKKTATSTTTNQTTTSTTKITTNHSPEVISVINQLQLYGWMEEEISQSLQSQVNNDSLFHRAYYKLTGYDLQVDGGEQQQDGDGDEDVKSDEQQAIQSIYETFTVKSDNQFNIKLDLGELDIIFPKIARYPLNPPVLLFKPKDKSLQPKTRHLLTELINQCKQSLSQPMLFTIIAFIDSNGQDILKNSNSNRNSNNNMSNNNNNNNNNNILDSISITNSNNNSNKVIKKHNNDRRNQQSIANNDKENNDLRSHFNTIIKSEKNKPILKVRESLPVFAKKKQFIEMLSANQVMVVTGETGSGKSTQIPQYILEDMVTRGIGSQCNIVCSQPRRISAIGVADRVSAEWYGGDKQQLGSMVGYQIRNESKRSAATRLCFVTTGILLRMMLDSRPLENVSHIIIDEVHERSMDNDFLLIILKQLLRRRPNLKLILMSATLDAKLIANYFGIGESAIFSIAGFTYPVQNVYLEDSIKLTQYKPTNYKRLQQQKQQQQQQDDQQDKESTTTSTSTTSTSTTTSTSGSFDVNNVLEAMDAKMDQKRINHDYIQHLICYLVRKEVKAGKSILVFVPGFSDILQIINGLNGSADSNLMWLLPLHSSLTPKDQQRVFERAPASKTKIIVATNIAETSITIDDIGIVVDTGRVNQMSYNAFTKNSMMSECWIAKASARQRAGRAGRTSAGVCYKLFTKSMEQELAAQETPEILRTPLQQLCLHVKLFQSQSNNPNAKLKPIYDFLAMAIEPPEQQLVQHAVDELKSINALDKNEQLTALGYHLSQLPVDIYIGKMLLFGCIFRCLDPILTIAATLSYKPPFITSSQDKSLRANSKFHFGHQSDHFSFFIAYDHWRKSIREGNEYAFCTENHLSIPTLRTIQDLKFQFIEQLSEIGFLPNGLTSKKISKLQKSNMLDEVSESCGAIYNSFASNSKVIKSVLCAGMYPKIARIDLPAATYTKVAAGAIQNKYDPHSLLLLTKVDKSKQKVFIHPRSVNSNEGEFIAPFLLYHERVQTSRMFMHHTTNISALTLLLFSIGGSIEIDQSFQHILLDKWLKFKATGKILVILKEVRMLLDELLNQKIRDPSFDTSSSVVIDIIIKIVTNEGFI
ncbi:DEAD/DEAH box helicase [Heterostelium album PN500]|uniref:RNA helicase n=1 Tax=Heterostelium pallidum (strain ATCC 26659 / Pp 5 / PN500) TaxID=670386 RepID=D3B4W2_HETP5|nr:DEAD/DEAH box helicase [Heterostelium album PN500]EFA84360.1 DEAD/DEAH box helicase [Heterostelium album PN500]|eukprot:XP_020436475.1 DEAD/DEAH box helicase [Heterostelium album PN500]